MRSVRFMITSAVTNEWYVSARVLSSFDLRSLITTKH